FIQMQPFTPKGKNNLAAWLCSRMDGEHYGELIVYRFPKDRLVFGPEQVMNRINQDADISRQITLWNDENSQTKFGTLLVIPVEESLIYIVPLYIRSKGGRLPELKRVIVSYEDRMVMEPTLDQAVERLFGAPGSDTPVVDMEGSAGDAGEETQADQGGGVAKAAEGADSAEGRAALPAAANDSWQRARRHYEAAIEAQRAGDWARYGEEVKALGRVLEKAPKGLGGPR
ncbi:MAG: UPF0182 family protein, partial [Myxococcales bacterium]|nr:UPF0182 family protein [Myxococcales bacterium]